MKPLEKHKEQGCESFQSLVQTWRCGERGFPRVVDAHAFAAPLALGISSLRLFLSCFSCNKPVMS